MDNKKYELVVSALLRYTDAMYRIAFTTVKNRDDALDVVQNATVKALERYQSLNGIESAKSWLFRIVYNESINFIKKAAREIPYEKEELPEQSYEEKGFGKEGEEVYRAVMTLPEYLRTVVILRYYEELSLQQIADITGININTVKSRLYSAHKKLGREIREEDL